MSADSADYLVEVNILVVPNGIREAVPSPPCHAAGTLPSAAPRKVLRLSLSVTPNVRPRGHGPRIDIRRWPEEIQRLAQCVRFALAPLNLTTPAQPIGDPAYCPQRRNGAVPGTFHPNPTKLWQDIFTGEQPHQIDKYFRDLINDLEGRTVATSRVAVAAGITKAAGTYPAADLGAVLNAMYGSTFTGELYRRLSGPGHAATTGTSRPTPAQRFGGLTVKSWRDLSEHWLPPAISQDAVASLSSGTSQGSQPRMPRASFTFQDMVLNATALRRARAGMMLRTAELEALSEAADRRLRAQRGMAAAIRYFRPAVPGRITAAARSFETVSAEAQEGAQAFRTAVEQFAIVRGLAAKCPEPARAVRAEAAAAVPPDPCDDTDDQNNAPGRKFTAILAHPTLAKYLGLIVDIDVPFEDFSTWIKKDSRTRGAIAAEFVEASASDPPQWPSNHTVKLDWTAFVYAPRKDAIPEYFGPCNKDESSGMADPLFKDGVIDLGVQRKDADRFDPPEKQRFAVAVIDVSQTTLAMVQRAEDIRTADVLGRVPAEQVTKLPNVPARGIAVFDRDPPALSPSREVTPRVSYAEDLMLGYRFDVAIDGRKPWKDRSQWRSLMCRDVTYLEDCMDPNFQDAYREHTREDSHVRTPHGETKYCDPSGEYHVESDHEQLLTWTGESLGAPSLHGDGDGSTTSNNPREIVPCKETDLAIGLTLDLPGEEDKARHPAPLREGKRYIFGARAYLVNGCGLSLDEAFPRYVTPDGNRYKALGEKPGTSFPYERRTEIHAPDVCLSWDDPIVSTKEADKLRGATVDTLIVRDGRFESDLTRRVLLPARTSFEMCEQAGMFDESPFSEENQPPGAFVGHVRVHFHEDTGALPIAFDGTFDFARIPPANEPAPVMPKSRGTVAVLGRSPAPGERQLEFYPDPLARMVCARLVVRGAPTPIFVNQAEPVAFWPPNASPSQAEPIVLQLRAASSGSGREKFPRPPDEPQVVGWFEQRPRASMRQVDGPAMSLSTLTVALEPGETADLQLWSMDDVEKLQERHWALAEAKRAAQGIAEWDPNKLRDAICMASIDQLNNSKTVRLVHAVAQPLDPPLPLEVVAVVIALSEPSSMTGLPETLPPGLRSWAAYVAKHFREPLSTWPSEANGSVTFFVGTIRLHRPSTVAVRCEATWEEHGPERVLGDPERGTCVYRPTISSARLFNVDEIDTRAPFRLEPVSLLARDVEKLPMSMRQQAPADPPAAEQLRALSFAFPDGKARRVVLTAIATSRFSDFYEPGSVSFERSALERTEVWVPATVRPPALEIDLALPVFHWDGKRSKQGTRIEFTRTASIRLYLKKGIWPWSEGDRLAVTFGPTSATGENPLCEFEKEVGIFVPFVTRWGADPIHRSGPLAILMPHERFFPESARELVPGKKLPFGPAPKVTRVTHAAPMTGDPSELPAGTKITIEGENFASAGVRVTVQGKDAELKPEDITPTKLVATLRQAAKIPLNVEVRNPELTVSLLAYVPTLDPHDCAYHCDISIDPEHSYFPFVQFGLARYQPRAAADLHLSPPLTIWAQVPPTRSGFVEFIDSRSVYLFMSGVGYWTDINPDGTPREPADFPILKVRLMVASTPRHVRVDPETGGIGWKMVLDDTGTPVPPMLLVPTPHFDGQKKLLGLEWHAKITLPRPHVEIRYGLLIDEIERHPTDPPDPALSVDERGELPVTIGDRSPLFWHIIDLGT